MSNIILYKGNSSIVRTSGSELTSTIKGQVMKHGGNVKAALRISIYWKCVDDYDLHLGEPKGSYICHGSPQSSVSCGYLDRDMNVGDECIIGAIENIIYPKREEIPGGEFRAKVHNYNNKQDSAGKNFFGIKDRGTPGFEAEIECDGKLYTFSHSHLITEDEYVTFAKFMFSQKHGITFIHGFLPKRTSRTNWQIEGGGWEKPKTLLR